MREPDPEKRLVRLLFIPLASFSITYIATSLIRPDPTKPLFADFFAFWSFARFVHTMPPEQIYNVAALQEFQSNLYHGLPGFYPYPYPPVFALLLYPFGYLDYVPAYVCWIAVTLAAYLLAVAGTRWASPRALATLAAPTTAFAAIAGQNGFLTAALMIGGLRLLARGKLVGAVLLGALIYKPQMCILVPVALLASREWRALLATVASGIAFAAASAVAFGAAMWSQWLTSIPMLWNLFEVNRANLGHLMPSVASNLITMGVDHRVAQGVQLAVSASVVVIVYRLFRSGIGALNCAVLLIGVFLATPYVFFYDLPMMTSAVIVVYGVCMAAKRPLSLSERGVFVLALVLPILLAMKQSIVGVLPIGACVLILLFIVVVRITLTMPRGPAIVPSPSRQIAYR